MRMKVKVKVARESGLLFHEKFRAEEERLRQRKTKYVLHSKTMEGV